MEDCITISRDLLERLEPFFDQVPCAETDVLRSILHPNPVTVQDFFDASREDEIKPGMWVEHADGYLGILPTNWNDRKSMYALDPKDSVSWYDDKREFTPRFDLQPAFQPNGEPFPLVH